ncbi:MAG: hypothetical protein ABJD07_08070 [Gemmatimonadaceae bacterium]
MSDPSPRAVQRRTSVPISVLALTLAACGGTDSAPRVPLGAQARAAAAAPADSSGPALPAAARLALDSGNAQYREKRFAEALASYRVAAGAAPGHTAPEFGVYMAAKQLGNRTLADSAQRIIAAHSGGSPMWTDSAMQSAHNGRGSSPAMPKSHPKL